MKGSLNFRYARNDLITNKGVNLALIVVLILSAFLMATGSMVMERLTGSVEQLFDEAKPPHFLQMHKGAYDPEQLTLFAAEHPEIDAWLVEEMLGFDGAAIGVHRPQTGESGDLAESLIDNLFVTQNDEFDFLIDEAGAIPRPSAGEVYVPVAYQQRFDLQRGDELQIKTDVGTHELQIQGFVRDAQMASSLSSATRFLVSETDVQELEQAGGGAPEIIVEYRFTDAAVANDVQRAYESVEALPKNGQAVTFEMIRLINAFSDGLVAIALMFASLLLIAIALLNVRFVIRGTLEAEVREIGAMKAIGVPHREITGLYLVKYRVMTLIGCIIGGVLAVGATNMLTQNIQANYAEVQPSLWMVLVPLLALTLVYLLVIGICRNVFRAVKKVEVVGALVHGSLLDERQTAHRAQRQAKRIRRTSLATSRGGSMNRRLAWLDLRAESRQWILIPLVFFLATVLMTLPMNLLSTFESPRFVTYMGAPNSDLRVDLQFSEDVDTTRDAVLSHMQGDDRLTDERIFADLLYETEGEEGREILRVEVGDYSRDTVTFLSGERPVLGQIALSVLNAEKFQLQPGDAISIRQGTEDTTLRVSGVYQDITSGGYTAKMQGEVTTQATGYVIYSNVDDGEDPSAIASEYTELFPAATVYPMQEYVQQTLSYVTSAFTSAAILSFLFGMGVAVLLTTLFLTLRITRDRTKMGVLSAIGFSVGEIIAQLRGKTLLAIVAGTVLGLVFASTVGEQLVGAGISLAGLGITQLEFIPNPWLVYLAFPLMLIAAGYVSAVAITARLRGTDTSGWLR